MRYEADTPQVFSDRRRIDGPGAGGRGAIKVVPTNSYNGSWPLATGLFLKDARTGKESESVKEIITNQMRRWRPLTSQH